MKRTTAIFSSYAELSEYPGETKQSLVLERFAILRRLMSDGFRVTLYVGGFRLGLLRNDIIVVSCSIPEGLLKLQRLPASPASLAIESSAAFYRAPSDWKTQIGRGVLRRLHRIGINILGQGKGLWVPWAASRVVASWPPLDELPLIDLATLVGDVREKA